LGSASRALDQDPQSPEIMHIRVRLFALAKERAGRSELELELPVEATVADLRARLRQRWPELAEVWSRALIALDQEYAEDHARITPGVELAVIPPVSGGTPCGNGTRADGPPMKEFPHR